MWPRRRSGWHTKPWAFLQTMPFAAPGTIDGNPVGPDSSPTDATTSSPDKGTSVIQFDDVAFTRVREIAPLPLSLSLPISPNPFAPLNCYSIISSQRSLRIRRAVYLIFIESILSFGIRGDSYVIKRNRPLLTYYVPNVSVCFPSRDCHASKILSIRFSGRKIRVRPFSRTS